MARIRSIKPELRRSLVVGAWPREVRYAFVLLWGYLDDYGRGVDDLRLITADLFPLDRDVTEKKMSRWLDLMTRAPHDSQGIGPVCRYEVAGQRYLHAINWPEHQRPNRPSPSRIPPCPLHESSLNHSVNGSLSPHGVITEGSLPRAQARVPAEQGAGSKGAGRREQGAREQGSTHLHDDDSPTDPAGSAESSSSPGDVIQALAKALEAELGRPIRFDPSPTFTAIDRTRLADALTRHGPQPYVAEARAASNGRGPADHAAAYIARWRGLTEKLDKGGAAAAPKPVVCPVHQLEHRTPECPSCRADRLAGDDQPPAEPQPTPAAAAAWPDEPPF